MLARLIILLGMFVAAFLPADANAERRVALVVGNSSYSHATSLRNPGNDARDVAETLKKVGFEVQLAIDVDQRSFATAVETFARLLDDADVGLFFYAGHGLQMNDKNYLVSVNAKLESEFLLSSETIELDAIVRLMESKAAINLVFLDACRNNPLTENLKRNLMSLKRSASLGRGLARMEPTGRDTLIAFAAAPGQEANDGSERNSPFTAALLRHLPEPGLEVSVMLKGVAADVRRDTRNSQRPQQLSDMTKAFYFTKAQTVAATRTEPMATPELMARPNTQATDDRALDVAFWNASQSANDCDAVRAYMQRFPTGVFIDLAKLAERRLCTSNRRVSVVDAPDRPEPAPAVNPSAALLAPAAATSSPATLSPAPASESSVPAGAAKMAAIPDTANAAPPVVKPTGPSPAELTRTIQLELYRLGCAPGNADGKWSITTREGLRRFNLAAKTKLDMETPSSATIAALQDRDVRVCPLQCGRGMQARGETCVAVKQEPPRKQRRAERPQRRQAAKPAGEAGPQAQPAQAQAPQPAAGPMMGPPMGGMFFFGMGRRF